MNGYGTYSEETQPVTYMRGYPIYAAHFVVAVFVASMLATTVLLRTGGQTALGLLEFSNARVLQGQVWRIFSYGLVNPPSLQFVIDMFMVGWFGRELEKFFGRRVFFALFSTVYLITPLLFTALGPWFPLRLAGETGAFALFLAFATLYPNVPLFFNVLAKWAAFILVGIFTMMALANHDDIGLLTLWATSGSAFVFVRFQQGLLTLPKLSFWKRKPKLRVLPDLPVQRTVGATLELKSKTTMAEVDVLLDKIAKSGIASLTVKERAKLESARENLMKRGGGRG
ncbi:MAG: hypothetical protein EXS37_17365 [Opitutus sp.]|nr:hypothetical protein [Opitutus sp.]